MEYVGYVVGLGRGSRRPVGGSVSDEGAGDIGFILLMGYNVVQYKVLPLFRLGVESTCLMLCLVSIDYYCVFLLYFPYVCRCYVWLLFFFPFFFLLLSLSAYLRSSCDSLFFFEFFLIFRLPTVGV